MSSEEYQKYKKWYNKQYYDILNLQDVQEYAKSVNNKDLLKLKKDFSYKFSNIWRFQKLADIRYRIPLKKTSYHTSVFKIRRTIKEHNITFEVNYGVIYSDKDTKEHEYACLAPTLRSSDGEYREKFIKLQQHLDWYHSIGKDYLADFEEYVLEQIANGDIELIIISDYIKEFQTKRLDIILYLCAWVVEYYKFTKNLFENHLHENYQLTMFTEKDKEYFEKLDLFDYHKRHIYENTRIRPFPKQKALLTQCGQKYIPLTLHTIENQNDVRVPAWREIYIGGLVSNLVINGICTGFPILNDWFLIDTSPEIYDNRISHYKLIHSKKAAHMIKQIEHARKDTYLWDPVAKKEIYISYMMENFSEKIELPLDYAEREIILSDYTLCMLSENVGRTFADHPRLCLSKNFDKQTNHMFSDFNAFEYYTFGYCYAMWCMNDKYGVIHGDLHLNNITSNLAIGEPLEKEKHFKFYSIYNIQGAFYMFHVPQREPTIIDFSRSFIWHKILDQKFSEGQIANLKEQHKTRLMRHLGNIIPDFTESHFYNLVKLSQNQFDKFYIVCEAMDPSKIFNNMREYIEHNVVGTTEYKSIADSDMLRVQVYPLLEELKDAALDYMIKTFLELFDNPDIEPKRINLELLKKFRHHLVENVPLLPDAVLCNYSSDQNTLRYNIYQYDNYPPMVKLEKAVEMKLESGLGYGEGKVKYDKYVEETDPHS